MNNIGKMYLVKKHYWLVFPRKAIHHPRFFFVNARTPELIDDVAAAYWSKELNCTVSYISPNDFVVLLEIDGNRKKILTSNGDIGWIWFAETHNKCFEEVRAE